MGLSRSIGLTPMLKSRACVEGVFEIWSGSSYCRSRDAVHPVRTMPWWNLRPMISSGA